MAAVELKELAFHHIMRFFLAVHPDSRFLRTYHIDRYGYQLVDFVSLLWELFDQDIIVGIIPDDLGIASPFICNIDISGVCFNITSHKPFSSPA